MHCINLYAVIFVFFTCSYIHSTSAWNKFVDLLYFSLVSVRPKFLPIKKYNNSPFDMVSNMPGDCTWSLSQYECSLSMYRLSIIKISQSWDCLILIMGISTLVVCLRSTSHLYRFSVHLLHTWFMGFVLIIHPRLYKCLQIILRIAKTGYNCTKLHFLRSL